MTQGFINPTRTNIYWYSPEKRYFWHRVGSRQMAGGLETHLSNAAGITVSEATDFYQNLTKGNMVAIGATRSPLKAESTKKILSRLKARSLLAAPISVKSDLLGFLAVEDNQPRIWEESERNYIRAIAQLVALASVNEDLEATLQQSQQDTIFSQTITKTILDSGNSDDALKQSTILLNQRLDTDYVFLLREEVGGALTLVHQTYPPDRHPLTTTLQKLTSPDRELILQRNREVLDIEDLQESPYLQNWLPAFNNLGIRSLIVTTTHAWETGEALSLMVLAQSNPRTWNSLEQSLVSIVAGQLRMLTNFFTARDQVIRANLISQTLEDGLKTLWSLPKNPKNFTPTWLEYLATTIACPLVSLWQWTPGDGTKPNLELGLFKLTEMFMAPGLNLPKNLAIPVTDALIQSVLQAQGFVYLTTAELSVSMAKIFYDAGLKQLLFVALPLEKTKKKQQSNPDQEPSSQVIFLFADEQQIAPFLWQANQANGNNPVLLTLLQHFVITRHYQQLQFSGNQERSDLQSLNWYKHCSLSLLHQSLGERISSLLQVDAKGPLGEGGQLQQMRTTQVLHQIEGLLSTLNPVLTHELWAMNVELTSVPLATLIKRSLRNLESVCQQRQIIPTMLNNLAGSAYADRWKLECIVFEVFLTCIFRSNQGSRLTILTKAFTASAESPSSQFLELVIVERPGDLEKKLEDTPARVKGNPPSIIFTQAPPLLHWKICQQIIRSWGGDLQYSQPAAGNFSVRLLLVANQ